MRVDPLDPSFAERARRARVLGMDFDGVMTDNSVYLFEDGREAVRCSRADGFGLRRLERVGVYCFLLSTEANPVVASRASKLKLDCLQNIPEKVEAFERVLAERGASMEEAAFIGNDINDLGLLERVGLPVLVADAHEAMNGVAAFRTRRRGGDGAVRELCDAIAAVLEGAA